MRALLLAVTATLLLAAPAAATPQWLQPADIAGPCNQNMLADVAVAADGTTLVAYSEFAGGFERIRARVRRPGQDFGPVMELSPADKNGSAPSAAVDGQGNFTVAFGVDDPATQIRAARLPAGAGVFEAVETVSAGATAALEPRIGVGAGGTAVIAYRQVGTVRGAIRNGPGGEFSDPTMLSDGGVTDDTYEVAVDDGGSAVVVWSRDSGGGADVVEASERQAGLGFPPAGDGRGPLARWTRCHRARVCNDPERARARAVDRPVRRSQRDRLQGAPARRLVDGHTRRRVETR